MEETRKRERSEENDVALSPVRRPRADTVAEDGGYLGEDVMAWLSVEDATLDELMNFLDATNDNATAFSRVKFIDNPYTSSLVFQSSSSYVTINGNEESCGSSFSDSESSVMVSVDMSGFVKVGGEGEMEYSRVVEEESEGSGGLVEGVEMDGCDGWDLDDYVLARFLGED